MNTFALAQKQLSAAGSVACAFCLVLSVMDLCPAVRGQQIDPEHGPHGNFVLGIDQKIGGANLNPAQRPAALALATTARDILERDSAVASPIGFSVRVNRIFGRLTDWADFDSGLPFYAGASGAFFEAGEKPSPTAFSHQDFAIYINAVLQCPLMEFSPPGANGKPWLVNGNLPVLQGGRRTGEFHGFPVYDGQCAILGRGNQPAFVPLTREQYIRFQIQLFKDRQAKMHQQFSGQAAPPAVQDAIASADQQINEAIAQQEQQLASMSPADRAAPAAVETGYEEAKLVDVDQDGAVPLSTPNSAFFDRSLPPSVIQSVAVYIPFLNDAHRAEGLPSGLPDEWMPVAAKIRDQLDWAALAALVRQQ